MESEDWVINLFLNVQLEQYILFLYQMFASTSPLYSTQKVRTKVNVRMSSQHLMIALAFSSLSFGSHVLSATLGSRIVLLPLQMPTLPCPKGQTPWPPYS